MNARMPRTPRDHTRTPAARRRTIERRQARAMKYAGTGYLVGVTK